jgi:hypothetical protein
MSRVRSWFLRLTRTRLPWTARRGVEGYRQRLGLGQSVGTRGYMSHKCCECPVELVDLGGHPNVRLF